MHTMSILKTFAVAVAITALAPRVASAASFTISLDTSPLSGDHLLAFGLTDGDGIANNTVTLSDFTFGTGSATAGTDDCTFGGLLSGSGCSGDLGSSVLLQDLDTAAGLTFFSQTFTADSVLSFTLNTTNNFAGGTPDGLAMYLCADATFSTCYSDDSSTFAMLVLDLSTLEFTLTGATDQGLAAPVVTAVPEPASLALLTAGLTSVVLRRRARGRARGVGSIPFFRR